MYASKDECVTRQVLQHLLYVLLPSPCLACHEPVLAPRDALGLCPSCRESLVQWPSAGCATCGSIGRGTHLPAGHRCGQCRRSPPVFERILSAWSYQPPIDATLTALKFRRLDYLGSHIGRRLADRFRARLSACEMVVPIPLHWGRYLRRGYNQATMIARPLANELGLPVRAALRRRRATPPQSRLSRAKRKHNLIGAFAPKRPARWRGRHLLLVDDVVTTGTTIKAAADCLMRSGAGAVTALTAARTPDSDLEHQALVANSRRNATQAPQSPLTLNDVRRGIH